MKKGDIIRRKLKNGSAIGQYMIVTTIMENQVYAKSMDSEQEFYAGIKENFKVYSSVAARLSKAEYLKIKYTNPSMYRHSPNDSFSRVFERKPDIVVFCAPSERKMYYRLEGVMRTYYERNIWIKLYLGTLIAK